jgi:hypothetical protein
MYDTVRAIIRKFLSMYEGELKQMYLDNRGLVTTGVGNLLQDSTAATNYQWEHISGNALASSDEVIAEYNNVKSDDTKTKIPNWKIMGGGNFVKRAIELGIVTLQLTSDSYNKIFTSTLNGLEGTMKGTPGYEAYETFPADAQMGILSVIWANGAGGIVKEGDLRLHRTWPNFTRKVKARQWGDIADKEDFKWKNINADRKVATKTVFQNAQTAEDQLAQNSATDVTIVLYPIP